MSKYQFKPNEVETVKNLIKDGGNDEQIKTFILKNFGFDEAKADALITKVKENKPAPEVQHIIPPKVNEPQTPTEETPTGEAPEGEAPGPDENEGEDQNEEATEGQMIADIVEKIEQGSEPSEADLIDEYGITPAIAKLLIEQAKREVLINQRDAQSKELEAAREKNAKELEKVINPIIKGINSLIVSVDKAIKFKRGKNQSFSRLASAKQNLTRLKRTLTK